MATTIDSDVTWDPAATLPGEAYWSEEIFNEERERLFFNEWFCVGREEEIPNPSDYLTADIAGESIIVTRAADGELRSFYNVCRHRGTKLCDDGPGHAKSGVFKCPYHAWTYTTEGKCVGTPNVRGDEGLDKSKYGLWSIAVDVWQGFIFVHMGDAPPPLADVIADCPDQPGQFTRYRFAELRTGRRVTYEVAANWKIIIENYNECLHCPTVHPELVSLIPIYRQGMVMEGGDEWGVHLAEGSTSLTATGASNAPRLRGITDEDARCYYGAHVFPTFTVDLHPDVVVAGYMYPLAPDRTLCVEDFLFDPETIADPEFDPSDIVDFSVLVSGQDQQVCEREQLGVRSRAYSKGGVYPYADRLVHGFNEDYRRRMAQS